MRLFDIGMPVLTFVGLAFFIMQSKWKSGLGATGSEICLKIHLRGTSEASESPITAHHGFSDRFRW